MSPFSVQRFIRRTEALRHQVEVPAPASLDHRVTEHMPNLIPRPSTPCTPAEIVRGTPRWAGVLVLRPVTVFGPSVGTPPVNEIQTAEEQQLRST
ncbi:hypothetical protein CspeluHIS016_0600640 [Cutaneotrichosporon spelunceum]|uniref:Uncharacterized protein n=1 Tax=Cutaneotrichosporon spelunceum TaxID=1672016 RepID=A0AAD3TXC7_9TREE|nr:hypothetical protein CspeluHIS016_0600640 [Cutaneotrichosporon spelunceum]